MKEQLQITSHSPAFIFLVVFFKDEPGFILCVRTDKPQGEEFEGFDVRSVAASLAGSREDAVFMAEIYHLFQLIEGQWGRCSAVSSKFWPVVLSGRLTDTSFLSYFSNKLEVHFLKTSGRKYQYLISVLKQVYGVFIFLMTFFLNRFVTLFNCIWGEFTFLHSYFCIINRHLPNIKTEFNLNGLWRRATKHYLTLAKLRILHLIHWTHFFLDNFQCLQIYSCFIPVFSFNIYICK